MKKYRPLIVEPLRGKMRYDNTALFLGVSVRTLRRWVRSKTIPFYRIGRRVYFEEAELLDWIANCHVEVAGSGVDYGSKGVVE